MGSLPIKFLGVPLISSKLSHQDCIPIIHRITKRASSWTSLGLSYAGRLQLIKAVLLAMQSFWCRHFILPKSVIRDIQSILGRFLWKGPSLSKFGAKVAWKNLAVPLKEGGLGLKNMVEWNKSMIMLHLINIIKVNVSSLWASWVKCEVLKRNNFWHIPIPADCSWNWRQILKLRHLALQQVKYLVGKGDRVSLWYDPWCNGVPINPSDALLQNSGLPRDARVADIIQNSVWRLPCSNYHDVLMLRRRIGSLPVPPLSDDKIIWDAIDINKIKAGQIWDSIRHRQQHVGWYKILWHQLHVPRYSFILWLGLLRKLPTNDVTRYYSAGRISSCPLCSQQTESFDHLFFNCGYSRIIFLQAMGIGNWQNFPCDWTDLIDRIMLFQGRNLTKNIISLTLAVSFYKIWEARNKSLHQNSLIPPYCLARDVVNIIKSRLSQSRKFIKATSMDQFYCNWIL